MEQTIEETAINYTDEELIADIKAGNQAFAIPPESIALAFLKEIAILFVWSDTYYASALPALNSMIAHFADPRYRRTLPEAAQEEGVEVLAAFHRVLSLINNNVEYFEYYASLHAVENKSQFPEDYQNVRDNYKPFNA